MDGSQPGLLSCPQTGQGQGAGPGTVALRVRQPQLYTSEPASQLTGGSLGALLLHIAHSLVAQQPRRAWLYVGDLLAALLRSCGDLQLALLVVLLVGLKRPGRRQPSATPSFGAAGSSTSGPRQSALNQTSSPSWPNKSRLFSHKRRCARKPCSPAKFPKLGHFHQPPPQVLRSPSVFRPQQPIRDPAQSSCCSPPGLHISASARAIEVGSRPQKVMSHCQTQNESCGCGYFRNRAGHSHEVLVRPLSSTDAMAEAGLAVLGDLVHVRSQSPLASRRAETLARLPCSRWHIAASPVLRNARRLGQHAHRGGGEQAVLDSLSPEPFSAPCSLLVTCTLSSPAGVTRVRTKERTDELAETSSMHRFSYLLPRHSQPAVPARRRHFASPPCQMEGKFCRPRREMEAKKSSWPLWTTSKSPQPSSVSAPNTSSGQPWESRARCLQQKPCSPSLAALT